MGAFCRRALCRTTKMAAACEKQCVHELRPPSPGCCGMRSASSHRDIPGRINTRFLLCFFFLFFLCSPALHNDSPRRRDRVSFMMLNAQLYSQRERVRPRTVWTKIKEIIHWWPSHFCLHARFHAQCVFLSWFDNSTVCLQGWGGFGAPSRPRFISSNRVCVAFRCSLCPLPMNPGIDSRFVISGG